MPGVRVATWNVNSALVRLPRLLPWLDERVPDVVCLQETKLADDAFAETFAGPLAERGYAVAHYGEGRWNGVALLSRVGLDDVVRGLPDEPGFPTPESPAEARAVSATCGGLRVDLGLRAQRPHPGRPALRLQARMARGPAGRRHPTATTQWSSPAT